MTPKRISIASLMGWVVVVAVGLVALRQANAIWASACFTLMLGILALAVFHAAFGRGRSRTFWAGFSLAGWSYLLAVYGVLARSDQDDPPPLLTRYAMLRLLAIAQPESVGLLPYIKPDGGTTPGPILIPNSLFGPTAPPAPPPLEPIDASGAVPPVPILAPPAPPAAFYPPNSVAAPVIQGPFVMAGSDSTVSFEQTAQSLVTLFLGSVGGWYALRLVAKRQVGDRPDTAAVSPSSP